MAIRTFLIYLYDHDVNNFAKCLFHFLSKTTTLREELTTALKLSLCYLK